MAPPSDPIGMGLAGTLQGQFWNQSEEEPADEDQGMLMDALPHHYHSDLTWEIDRRGWLSAPPRKGLLGGLPPQFGGTEDAWSPEHLLVASANLCLMLTFLSLAEKSRLEVRGYRSQAEGILDRTGEGLQFDAIEIRVELAVPPEKREQAESMLRKAEKHCLIANSLRCPVRVIVPREVPA